MQQKSGEQNKRVLAILLGAGIYLMFTGCSLIRNVADMGKHAGNLVKELEERTSPRGISKKQCRKCTG